MPVRIGQYEEPEDLVVVLPEAGASSLQRKTNVKR